MTVFIEWDASEDGDAADYSEYDEEAERITIAEIAAEAAQERADERAEARRAALLDNDDYDLDAIPF
jgi:hypothetical protein